MFFYYMLCAVSGVFSIVTLKIYYDAVFGQGERRRRVWFYITAVLGSAVLFLLTVILADDFSLRKIIIMMASNFIFDF